MEIQVWSDVQVDAQTELAAATAIAAISPAAEAVVTAYSHGLSDNDVVLIRARNMEELDYLVCRVQLNSSDEVVLKDVNIAASKINLSGATIAKLTFGARADSFTDVTSSGGDPEKIAINTINRKRKRSTNGSINELTYELGAYWKPTDPVLVAMKDAGLKNRNLALSITFTDGTEVLFSGVPSATLAPTGSAGAAVTTSASIGVTGPLHFYLGAD